MANADDPTAEPSLPGSEHSRAATRSGPTQGAEKKANPHDEWGATRGLALLLRILIFVAPVLTGVAFSWVLGLPR